MNLVSQVFQNVAFLVLESKELTWKCQCSWERVERALVLVGSEELRSILDEKGSASVRCEFCTHEYVADSQTLEDLIAKASGTT